MPELSPQRHTNKGPGHPPVSVVALLGGTGFVGGAVAAELGARGVEVRRVAAPRLRWTPNVFGEAVPLALDGDHDRVVGALAQQLDGAQVVINAAGIAEGTVPASPALFGANALLPALVARASSLVRADRFVHVSSAAVQGTAALDETPRTAPFSPYSRSKALGEQVLLRQDDGTLEKVVFRSTWVHDVDRPNTRAVIRLARSPLACVAGDGRSPSPQVLVSDIATAVRQVVFASGPVPPIVLQPPNGMTTGLLLRLLGGREPRHVPEKAARTAVYGLRAGANLSGRINAHARRLEMLLFGKPQVPGWLAAQGLTPALCPETWERLADERLPVATAL